MVKYRKMESSKLVSGDEERRRCGCGYISLGIVFIALVLIGIFLYFRPNNFFEIENIWNTENESDDNRTNNNSPKVKNKTHFLMNPVHLCQNFRHVKSEKGRSKTTNVKVVILLTSSLRNGDLRDAIRDTWGSLARRPEAPFRLAFIVGTSPNDSAMASLIENENRLYKDIIQSDIPDDAQNRTTKSAMLLRWAADYCSEAEFVLKADDDVFIDVGYLLKILLNDQKYSSKKPFIGGYLGWKNQTHQNTEKKEHKTKPKNQTQDHVSLAGGPTLVIEKGAVEPLYEMTLMSHSDLPFDDILLSNAGIDMFEDKRFQKHPPPQEWPEFKGSVCAYGYNPVEMRSLYQQYAEDAMLLFLLQDLSKASC